MSEKLLRFLLGELKTVRVHCLNGSCKAIVEVPIDRLKHTMKIYACPVCTQPFRATQDDGVNHLHALADAIGGLQRAQSNMQVEFVLPDEGK